MQAVAYCRVSTEDQAEEGFSIEGQISKLSDYARVHDLGEVTVVTDAGLSGRNLNRPGLQQVLQMVEAGDVAHVLIWRLDRLSRNLGDLILLADQLGQAGVALHSFSERIDLSTATGRMFYNVLGSFAQFLREQLSENVQMGMAQARAEGYWVNRPPTGYDLVDRILVPNSDAPKVVRIFEMRANGASQTTIEDTVGVKHSTVVAILRNRAYLGEMRHKDTWLPGRHQPLITEDLWEAAHKGRAKGVKRGQDLMSGKVRCGVCGDKMSIDSNGRGQRYYRCKHRGSGCKLPVRSNKGVLKAAVLGLDLLLDEDMRSAIRRHLAQRREPDAVRRRRTPASTEALAALHDEQTKLLQLHYKELINDELFAREQARIADEIEHHTYDADVVGVDAVQSFELDANFEELVALLDKIRISDLWPHATDSERRTLLDELVEEVEVHEEHLTVQLQGAPPLRVAFDEVGLKHSGLRRVGGLTRTIPYRPLATRGLTRGGSCQRTVSTPACYLLEHYR